VKGTLNCIKAKRKLMDKVAMCKIIAIFARNKLSKSTFYVIICCRQNCNGRLDFDVVMLILLIRRCYPKSGVEDQVFSSHRAERAICDRGYGIRDRGSMAIAIARRGGIGVIHKEHAIEEQARQVAIVKRARTV
jgi:hypothetical protein